MRGKPKLIKRTDSPFWFIYVPKSGRCRAQRLSTGESDYRQAERVFAQWLLERKKPLASALEETRLIDLLERYAEHKSADATVGFHLRRLRPFFKNVFVSQVNNQLVREYTASRTAEKVKRGKETGNKLVSSSTVRRELDTLSAALGFAKREGYIGEVPYVEKPKASSPRERWLTVKEYAKLYAAAQRDYFIAFIEIAIASGARPSSILELKWFQIDLENRLIHFNPPGREQTKKYRPSVFINDTLLPLLARMRDETTSEFVISRKNGRRVQSIKKSFKESCRRAELKGVTPYTLRHTAITWGIQGGKSLAQMGQLAGHKEPRTTSRYAKHDPSFTREAVGVLSTGALLAHKMAKKIKNQQKSSEKIMKKQMG